MGSPPIPVLPPLLLALLARLASGWRSIDARGISGAELGHLIDGSAELALYLDGSAGPGSIAWTLLPSTSPGLGPFALTEETARTLAGAELDDGTLVYQSRRVRLAAMHERGQLIAVLVSVDETAA